MSDAFALRARRVVTPDGVIAATVRIADGRIAALEPFEAGDAAQDLGDAWLLPGLVDSHVHVNDPGREEWEGFASATRAAAAGGITTLVDMPLNSIPATTSAEALAAKARAAAGRVAVDVAFWGGVVPGNAAELEPLAAAGARGFKCFLAPSGVAEFTHVGEAKLREALPRLARTGLPLLAHAELPAVLAAAPALPAGTRAHADWAASRPPEAEIEAIRLLLTLVREYGFHLHVVHVAAAGALPLLRAAKDAGLPVTAETCPHYLFFDAAEVPDGATEYKCAPPLRDAAHREALWRGLEDGTLDLVASDHSPSPPSLKQRERGDFAAAWGGIASLELSLAATWTALHARHPEEAPEPRVARLAAWMSAAPARLAGLARKGAIAPGRDADLVAWHPRRAFTVDAARLHQRHPLTPYHGRELLGVVERTWLRGACVFERGRFAAPAGQVVLEPRSRLG